MANYVVRPTSSVSGSGLTASAGTVLGCVGDNSDTTFVYNPGSTTKRYEFGLGAPSIAADEYVARVGYSMRTKSASTTPNYTVGSVVYRSTDSLPGVSTMYADSPSFTTAEVAYSNVSWSVADCASLRQSLYDGRSSSSWARTDHADIWATIYTIKRATATSANFTSSASKPTFSVSVTATIDWEATASEMQFRVIEHQVWIESGGTAPGTGTFVGTIAVTSEWTASGTQNFFVQFDRAIANGTYKFYVRAIRRRANGASSADTIGAWSTGYTLTQSVTLPTAPTVSATYDQTNDRVQVSVTPVTTSGYTTPTMDVERTIDGGTTWTTIRGGSDVAGTFGSASTFYDYEAPRGVTLQYRANVTALYTSSGFYNTSSYSTTATGSITADTWNLKVPENAALNDIDVNVVNQPGEEVSEDLGVFRPLDRRYPVIVAGTLSGWDGDLNIITTTAAEWTALKAVIESQKVLLLESPFGWAKYIRLVGGAKTAIAGTPTAPRRTVAVAYVETTAP